MPHSADNAYRFPGVQRAAAAVRRVYRRIFSVSEIERSVQLQWMFGASLLFFYVTFADWIGSLNLTVELARSGEAVCWPFFQDCYKYYFLHALPWGYSQNILYMSLFAVMAAIVWAMLRKHWTLAHGLLLSLFVYDAAVTLVFSYQSAAPYSYYHLALTAMLLFAGHKEFFLKLCFVFLYFLSATTKIDSTWILGTYFTTLKLGMPLFPGWSTAILTNLVLGMQMVGSWFLLSKRPALRYAALSYFAFFHWYSGLLVEFRYPTMSLPAVLILFGPLYRQSALPYDRRTIIGWIIIGALCLFQILGFYAPGDRRITLEGNKFGMFMFEANHQCIVTVEKQLGAKTPIVNATYSAAKCNDDFCLVQTASKRVGDSVIRTDRYESGNSWNRCYPYVWWSKLHLQCARLGIPRIGLKIDHAINGGAFYRIVDVSDICAVQYKTLGPNDWIVSPPQAKIMGYSVQDVYRY